MGRVPWSSEQPVPLSLDICLHPESCSASPSWPWLGCPVTMESGARTTDTLRVPGFTFGFINGQTVLGTYCVPGLHRDGEVPTAVLLENLESWVEEVTVSRVRGGSVPASCTRGALQISCKKWVRAVRGKDRDGAPGRGTNLTRVWDAGST